MAESRHDDATYTYTPVKRAKQACENCRRKKSKCSGERPNCSCCMRLKQRCMYAKNYRPHATPIGEGGGAPEAANASNESNRLAAIENMLKQLAAAVDLPRPVTSGESSMDRSSNTDLLIEHVPETPTSEPSLDFLYPGISQCMQDLQLPRNIIFDGFDTYFSHYCNQPCPILAHSSSIALQTGSLLPEVVLLPMLALSLRSSDLSLFRNRAERRAFVDKLTQLSWQSLVKAYSEFDIDDAYFQGLCLLAQVDLGDGNCERARAQIALGLRIAQGRDMLGVNCLVGLGHNERACRLEIVWSLFMLDRMLLGGNTRVPTSPSKAFELPVIQCGPPHPDTPFMSDEEISLHYLSTGAPGSAQSAVRFQIQIIEVWESVVAEIAQPPSSTDVPIWRHDSPRAAILTKLLEFEMRCETAGHTLSSTGSPTRVLEEPQLAGYFLVWLRFQLMLCVMSCCLNHPFIVHIKTSSLKDRVPLTFLQKSYEASLIHANWVTRMLNDMDEAGLMLHDPFIGHLVAIAASIHLEHTMSQYPTVAESATHKFNKCLDFVRRLSTEWPDMHVTASLLEQLRRRIRHRSNMNYVEAEYDGEAPPRRDRQVHLEEEDLRLLWKLFDYVSTSSAKSMTIPNLEEGDTPDVAGTMLYPDTAGVDFLLTGNSDTFAGTAGQATYSNLENITVDSIFSFGAFDISYGD